MGAAHEQKTPYPSCHPLNRSKPLYIKALRRNYLPLIRHRWNGWEDAQSLENQRGGTVERISTVGKATFL